MPDSISGASDSELLTIATNLHTTIATTPTVFGLTAAFATALEGARDDFDQELTLHVTKQAAAKSQRLTKDQMRSALEVFVRDARTLAKAAKTSEANIASMGIPSQSAAAPANATVPAASVDTRERLRHTISFRDHAFPENKRKPRGTVGAEIWVKVGETAPGNEKDCVFLTLDTLTPHVAEYEPTDAGKTAHYMLRWSMRDGSVSAWGETVSATITG
jgi:hypothetical protein